MTTAPVDVVVLSELQVADFSMIDKIVVNRETNGNPLLSDFNNDGHLDLSMINPYRIFVDQLYEGVGNGSFRDVPFRTGAFAANAAGQATADFDWSLRETRDISTSVFGSRSRSKSKTKPT